MSRASIAVIGAGLAGIACAEQLRRRGHAVRVLDKSRGAGGRMATRRTDVGSYDHGAQYFTVRDAAFAEVIARAERAGAVARWRPRWPGGEQEQSDLWVGVPGMPALSRWLAQGLVIETGSEVHSLSRTGGQWVARLVDGQAVGAFDFVVIAVPAPQAATLLQGHTALAQSIAAVTMAPCWSVQVAFDSPLAVPIDANFSEDDVLPWFARNAAKPARPEGDTWVLHAGPAWSVENLELPGDRVTQLLLARFAMRIGQPLPEVRESFAHRWRHARVETPYGQPFADDLGNGLAACGDWCIAARVEAAFVSGTTAGRALSERLGA